MPILKKIILFFVLFSLNGYSFEKISLSDNGIVVDDEVLGNSGQVEKENSFVRARITESGECVILVSAGEEKTVNIFGNDIKFENGGKFVIARVDGVFSGQGASASSADDFTLAEDVVDFLKNPKVQSSYAIDATIDSSISDERINSDSLKNLASMILEDLPFKESVAPSNQSSNFINTRIVKKAEPVSNSSLEDDFLEGDLPIWEDPADFIIGMPAQPGDSPFLTAPELDYGGISFDEDYIAYDITPVGERDDVSEYVVQPGDTIDIHFYRIQRATVDMNGNVKLIGAVGNAESVVRAAGKTPTKLTAEVAKSGLNFQQIMDPAIKVKVASYADDSIAILGEGVTNPGRYQIRQSPITLAEALDIAGTKVSSNFVYLKRGERIKKIDLKNIPLNEMNRVSIIPGDVLSISEN